MTTVVIGSQAGPASELVQIKAMLARAGVTFTLDESTFGELALYVGGNVWATFTQKGDLLKALPFGVEKPASPTTVKKHRRLL